MQDLRMKQLAEVLVNYSTKIKSGEVVYVEAFDISREMLEILVDTIYEVGGVPLISLRSESILRKLYLGATDEGMRLIGDVELYKMMKADAYIGMKGPQNITEHSDVPEEKLRLYRKYWFEPVHMKRRLAETRWVTLRWPTPSMAQQANMSTEAFEDLYFKTCTMDYSKMSKAMDVLKKRMEISDQVQIKGPGTDIRFSILGIPIVACDGRRNLPDGEVFTAPIKDSLEGIISFNVPTIHMGQIFTDVRLRFEKGRIVEASGSNTQAINDILNSDEGARYVGEFGIGVNPYIKRPMTDILFDEKMTGSIHIAPGNAYERANNGNRSGIHWDMVLIQRKHWGGGEIYFDGNLILKDGRFIPEELKPLNPENLKGEQDSWPPRIP